MSALDNISELATYKVPVTITVEYKAEVKVTGRDWDDINEKIDEYIDEYYDDIATEVVASTGESELKKWEERFLMHTIYSSDGTYSVCPNRPDGSIVWISPIIRKDMKYKCITVKLVEQRLAEGWSDYQAIHLSTKYVTHDGEICYKYSSPERTLYIPLSDIEKAQEEYELNTRTISKRLNRGMGLYEALTTLPAGAQDSVEKDVKKYQKIEDEKEKKRQQRLSYYKERKKRERKPHMYDGTPQQHTFGKYAQYLADSYKFKCAEVVK